jgi:hypothetical protein
MLRIVRVYLDDLSCEPCCLWVEVCVWVIFPHFCFFMNACSVCPRSTAKIGTYTVVGFLVALNSLLETA